MPKVTIFKTYLDTKTPEYIEIDSYIDKIREGEWEDIVHGLRKLKNPEEQSAYKATMPTVSMSGEFSYRSDESLIAHNGFLAIDLDDLDELEMARVFKIFPRDNYVYAAWVSAGGRGYRMLFKIDGKKHEDSFRGVCAHIFDVYGQVSTLDKNGKNLSKPYIVSYDPNLYYNDRETPVFKKIIKESTVKRITDFVHTASDFDKILANVVGAKIDICPDYQDWLKICFAISEQFGEAGRDYFHRISQSNPKYRAKMVDKQYTNCLKARGSSKVGISTFYYLAKQAGISITSENTKKITRYARNGKKAGLSKLQIAENLEKFENIKGADELVGKIYDSNEDNGDEEDTILHLLEMFVSNSYNLRMNEVTGYLEQGTKQLSASDLNTIFIAAKKVIPKLDYQLMMRLLKSDFIESYNPFFEFFGSDGIAYTLPAIPEKTDKVWESPVIEQLASCVENDDPAYTLFFLRKWLVSIVSAAHKVHSPLLLCFLGAQNSGKTEFFRRLLPKELSPYYAESKLDKEKDDELLMTESLVIMDDELGGKSKSDSLKLKNLTSKQWFSIRRPYGDHNEKILRLAVLCGTSNYFNILSDDTGNRRIIPIEVKNINKELYNTIDKKELFLECFKLYKEGFDWRVTGNDINYLNKDAEKYEQELKEKQLVEKYFQVGDTARLSTTDILVEIELITKQKLSLNLVGRQLKALGFQLKSTRGDGGSTSKKWSVSRINRHVEAFTNDNPQNTIKDEDLPF